MSYCESCDRRFKDKKALKQHRKDSPNHIKTVLCKICGRYFDEEDALQKHQNDKHHRIDPQAYRGVPRAPVNIPSTGVSATNQVSSVSPMDLFARACERKSRQSRQTAPSDTSVSDVYHVPDLPWVTLENQARSSALPDLKPITAHQKVNKANAPKRKEETRTSFKFPELHQRIADAVAPSITSLWFHDDKRGSRFDNEYLTCVMGKFTCDVKSCRKRQWSSGVVAILIRGYGGNGYSAVVFNQRCKSCDRLGSFKLDEDSYIERVAYRLKKWAGVLMAPPVFEKKGDRPHERRFCEGCKVGLCPLTDKIRSY